MANIRCVYVCMSVTYTYTLVGVRCGTIYIRETIYILFRAVVLRSYLWIPNGNMFLSLVNPNLV